MRVVVNQFAGLGQKTGIGHYTAELLRCMRTQSVNDEILEFPTGWLRRTGRTFKRARAYLNQPQRKRKSKSDNQFPRDYFNFGFRFSDFTARQRSRLMARLRKWGRDWAAYKFRAMCAQEQFDLYHEPNFVPFSCDCPTVVTIHDLSVLLHPEWHPADRVIHYEKNFEKGLAQANHLLAISEFGRQEVVRYLGVSPDRVTRTYMGIRRGFGPLPEEEVASVLARLGLPKKYFLFLGTIEPRKNVLQLMQTYCALPANIRADWPLLLVGGWGWNTLDTSEYFHTHARHRGVIHVGYIKDRYLPAVYNGARALIYPSLYEGFGLPPLEMMACGGATIASNAGALVETIGCHAHLVEPQDVQGWITAMTRVVQDDDWWHILRQGARQVAEPFTWERCATDTLAVYRRAVSGNKSLLPRRAAG